MRITSKWILKKHYEKAWTGFFWLIMRRNGGVHGHTSVLSGFIRCCEFPD
jgi:hypothetical protein